MQDMEKVADHRHPRSAPTATSRKPPSILGIDRSTLYEKIKKYEIPRP